jgi:hypothetical protein
MGEQSRLGGRSQALPGFIVIRPKWYNGGMETTYTPLPAELRPLLPTHDGEPLRLLDGQTQKVYLLVEQPATADIDEEYLRQALVPALAEEARGEIGPLDFAAIRNEGRRILAARESRQVS